MIYVHEFPHHHDHQQKAKIMAGPSSTSPHLIFAVLCASLLLLRFREGAKISNLVPDLTKFMREGEPHDPDQSSFPPIRI